MSLGNYPLISVYMPTHNRARILSRAIDSVVSQDYQDWELIIVDDGSTDNTQDVIRPYLEAHSKIRLITHSSPRGACAARNSAIFSAKGEFVTGIDDDDQFLPHRLSELLDAYSDEFAFVCSAWDVYPFSLKDFARRVMKYKKGRITLDMMRRLNHVGNQVLVRRQRLIDCGGFDEQLAAWQDYDMWLRLMKKFGDAYKLGSKSQIVYVDASIGQRITTSPRRVAAIKIFVENHSDLLTNDDKRRFLSGLK